MMSKRPVCFRLLRAFPSGLQARPEEAKWKGVFSIYGKRSASLEAESFPLYGFRIE